jgi:hypothetical protein
MITEITTQEEYDTIRTYRLELRDQFVMAHIEKSFDFHTKIKECDLLLERAERTHPEWIHGYPRNYKLGTL